jgi:hypothetical protein
MSIKVVVIDKRAGSLAPDYSNVEGDPVGAKLIVDEAKIVISVHQDGIFVDEGTGKVALMRVRSEPEMSMEKAVADKAARTAGVQPIDKDQAATDALQKFTNVWDEPDSSGTETITGV